MKAIQTNIEGCFVIEPTIFGDDRGFFYESFNKKNFDENLNLISNFIQDNVAYSEGKVMRGMHYQKGEFAQAKLVGVHIGEVQDVVVDMRKNSATFGNVVSENLSAENKKQLYIPRGCAHGYLTISEKVLFYYKCDNFYNKSSEGGLYYNDEKLQKIWQLSVSDALISDKDRILPTWENINFEENKF